MTRIKSLLILIAAGTLVLVGMASAQAQIRIAAAGPFTGKNIFEGERVQEGAQLAVANLKEGGGFSASTSN